MPSSEPADAADPDLVVGRKASWPFRPARRRRGARQLPVLAVSLLAAVALVGPGPVRALVERAGRPAPAMTDAVAVPAADVLPPVPTDARPRRLLPPAPAPAGSGGFRVLHVDRAGTPVRFDPCRPVHWVMRREGAPRGALELVHEQIEVLSRATGLRFVYDGPTDEPPREQRPAYQPERYGDRWAPVLVAWTDDREQPRLAGRTVGLGGAAVVDDGGPHLVAGAVLLDRPALTNPFGGVSGRAAHTVLHELGHLVGLDHVDDPAQLMHSGGSASRLGDGDRRGLHLMGSGPCSTRPSRSDAGTVVGRASG